MFTRIPNMRLILSKNNKCLAKLVNYCSNLKMKPKFMNTENSKTNEPHKFILSMSQRLDLRSSTKHVLFENLCTFMYLINNNIKQLYKSNKIKKITLTTNDNFELPDGSCSISDIQDYFQLIIKKIKHYQLILLFIFTSIELIIY